MNIHLHKYRIECKAENGHNHRICGTTEKMIGINSFHIHYFCGISSYNNHTHYYSAFTGLPVKTENGHIHKIEGVLESNAMHEHSYNSYTFEDVAYMSRELNREAFV